MFSHLYLYYFEKNIKNNIKGAVLNLQGCKYNVVINIKCSYKYKINDSYLYILYRHWSHIKTRLK